ncbi:hypothetical protein GCM10008932_15870 [Alkalibacterium iburiense]|uniref:Uncharacterized protein n=1 Tax=Alkalibacterium iburiense TaxID=290589 RepID=A0ABN0XHH8_9LACT
MQDWAWLFFVGTMILASAFYRFIMVNDNFTEHDLKKMKAHNLYDYVFSCYLYSSHLFKWSV